METNINEWIKKSINTVLHVTPYLDGEEIFDFDRLMLINMIVNKPYIEAVETAAIYGFDIKM